MSYVRWVFSCFHYGKYVMFSDLAQTIHFSYPSLGIKKVRNLGSRRWETSIILLQIAEVSRVFLPEPFELTLWKIWVPYLDYDFLQGRWHALVNCRQNETRTSLPCIQYSPKLPSSPSTDITSANTALADLWALVGLLAFPLDMDGNLGAGSFCVSKNRRQGTIAIAHRGIWFVV